MQYLNVEIKAKCTHFSAVREYLVSNAAEFKGADTQTDTYFITPNGRLKLREGTIENNLIFYSRENLASAKNSWFALAKTNQGSNLKEVLSLALGELVVVKKKREIYFLENVKFHLDTVNGLGTFVEIEACNMYAPHKTDEALQEQCNYYKMALGIADTDLLTHSYSDMLLNRENVPGISF